MEIPGHTNGDNQGPQAMLMLQLVWMTLKIKSHESEAQTLIVE